MVAITETIENAPKQKYRFIFLNRTDDATYINKAATQPFDRFVPETWRLNAEQLARTGSGESAYEWAQCETMRDETETDLEGFGFEASWKRERVELSGPRGLDFPPSDLMSVYALVVVVVRATHAVARLVDAAEDLAFGRAHVRGLVPVLRRELR